MKHAIKHIHFVGVGGAGMSGIAEVLRNLGYQISGSDLHDSPTLRRLETLGIKTCVGHAADNVIGADAVVTSTAVQTDNPEVVAARQRKIPVTYVWYSDEGHGFSRVENRRSFYAVTELFLARHLGGRAEPVGDDFKGSTIEFKAGRDLVLT